MQVNQCTFRDASAYSGGAVYNDGMLTLNQSAFYANFATYMGGAIYNDMDGTVQANQCSFTYNYAQYGGAIYNNGQLLDVTASTLFGNSAMDFNGSGGGIYNDSWATVTSCTFAGNDSWEYGSAIYNTADLTIQNSTLGANPDIGSLGCIDNTSSQAVTINGCIIASEADGNDLIGSFTGSNNLIDDATHSLISPGLNNLSAPAHLAPLGYYGGPTQTMPPMSTSPAIGTGIATTGITTDQRGLPLPSSMPDIGAFQTFTAPSSVTLNVISPSEIDLAWSNPGGLVTEYNVLELMGGAWVPLDTVDGSQSGYDATGLLADRASCSRAAI